MSYNGLFVLRYVQIKGLVIVKVALIPKAHVLLVSVSLIPIHVESSYRFVIALALDLNKKMTGRGPIF